MAAAPDVAAPRHTKEVMGYIQRNPPEGCGVTVSTRASAAEFKKNRQMMTDPQVVAFVDARTANGGLGSWELDTHGFTLVRPPPPVDFRNRRAVLEEYYPKVVELAKRITGAKKGYAWTHLTRNESSKGGNAYARFAHSDAGAETPPMLRLLLMGKFGVPEEEARTCDILWVNFWHPLDRPAYKDPLCLLDYTSVKPAEEVVNIRYVFSGGKKAFVGDSSSEDRRFLEMFWGKPTMDKFSESDPAPSNGAGLVGPTYSQDHRWVYCSDQRPDEAWIFKQWDTREGVAPTTFHSSFHDPFYDADPDTPGRRSAEFRVLLTFPKEKKAAVSSKL